VTSTDTKLRVIGIDHVVLHVGDLERARRFYVELLGFDLAHEFPGHIFLECGTQMVGLFEHRGELHARSEMNHLALRLSVGDYDTVKAVLEAAGIVVTGRPGDDRCIYFNDPDGHRLQLLTPGEH
jgi:catechol 2,3-dioxygenase-like lactoylglutathione lyase family enzyme